MVDSGALEGRIAAALEAVIVHGPGTATEIIVAGKLGANRNLWRARFCELQERDLIREQAQRKCTVTGRLALVWAFTGRETPLHVPRRRGKAKAMIELAKSAIEQMARLGATSESLEAFREKYKELGGR